MTEAQLDSATGSVTSLAERWRESARRLVPWCLRLAALLLPLSEGVTQGALLAALVLTLLTGSLRPGAVARGGLPARLVSIGLCGWIIVGTVAIFVGGVAVRSSNLNKAVMSVGILLGISLVTGVGAQELRRLLVLLAVGSALAVLAGLCQVAFGAFPLEYLLVDPQRGHMGQLYVPGTDYRALTGTLRNRTKLAEALLFVLAALSAASVLAQRSREQRIIKYGLVILLMALVLTFTKASPAAAIFAAISTLALESSQRVRRWYFGALGLVLLAGTIIAVASSASLPHANYLPATDMWTTRQFIWSHALEVIRDHPWLGVGLGAYSRVSPAYYADPVLNYAFTLNAHSQHLTALAETGIVGFAFWLTMCVDIGVALKRAWRRELEGAERGLRHLATYYLIALAPMSLVHDVLYHPVTALLVWASIGIVLSLAATQDASEGAT